MNIIRSTSVLRLLALLVLAPAAATLSAPPVSETVRIGESLFRPFLTDRCGFPEEIQIIGVSKLRTFFAAARRLITLVVDWAECKQLLPFSITRFWLPVRGAGHISGSLSHSRRAERSQSGSGPALGDLLEPTPKR